MADKPLSTVTSSTSVTEKEPSFACGFPLAAGEEIHLYLARNASGDTVQCTILAQDVTPLPVKKEEAAKTEPSPNPPKPDPESEWTKEQRHVLGFMAQGIAYGKCELSSKDLLLLLPLLELYHRHVTQAFPDKKTYPPLHTVIQGWKRID